MSVFSSPPHPSSQQCPTTFMSSVPVTYQVELYFLHEYMYVGEENIFTMHRQLISSYTTK